MVTTYVEPPLSDLELDQWLSRLGTTDAARIEVLQDLIRHRIGDNMSEADRIICMDNLKRLRAKQATPRKVGL